MANTVGIEAEFEIEAGELSSQYGYPFHDLVDMMLQEVPPNGRTCVLKLAE